MKNTYLNVFVILITGLLIYSSVSCSKNEPISDNPQGNDSISPNPDDTVPDIPQGNDSIPPYPIDTIQGDTTPGYSWDTIFPLSYLPVWPGSYWKYTDSLLGNNSDTLHLYTLNEYILDFFYPPGKNVPDSFYLPLYIGDPELGQSLVYPNYGGMPIWEYFAYKGPTGQWMPPFFRRVLKETWGEWKVWGWAYEEIYRKVIGLDLAIEIDGHVYEPTIAIKKYYTDGPPGTPTISIKYYTRDIGMIKYEKYILFETEPSEVWQIVDYHVNNK
jgi:hypothetical protein